MQYAILQINIRNHVFILTILVEKRGGIKANREMNEALSIRALNVTVIQEAMVWRRFKRRDIQTGEWR